MTRACCQLFFAIPFRVPEHIQRTSSQKPSTSGTTSKQSSEQFLLKASKENSCLQERISSLESYVDVLTDCEGLEPREKGTKVNKLMRKSSRQRWQDCRFWWNNKGNCCLTWNLRDCGIWKMKASNCENNYALQKHFKMDTTKWRKNTRSWGRDPALSNRCLKDLYGE